MSDSTNPSDSSRDTNDPEDLDTDVFGPADSEDADLAWSPPTSSTEDASSDSGEHSHEKGTRHPDGDPQWDAPHPGKLSEYPSPETDTDRDSSTASNTENEGNTTDSAAVSIESILPAIEALDAELSTLPVLDESQTTFTETASTPSHDARPLTIPAQIRGAVEDVAEQHDVDEDTLIRGLAMIFLHSRPDNVEDKELYDQFFDWAEARLGVQLRR